MPGFIFYDLECTGLSPAFDVPLQAAFILTDDNLVVHDEIVFQAQLPDHIVPSPEALLITGLTPAKLIEAPLSQTQMMRAIADLLARAAPATVIGYNNLRYDEEILRQAFFQNLLPPYATSYDGHRRADVLTMARAVTTLEPRAVQVPHNDGKQVFRLGEICRMNGIALPEHEAHDALHDARATLALFRFIREQAPATVAALMQNADKRAVHARLDAGGILGLFEFSGIVPVTPLTSSPGNASSIALADLTVDPGRYLDLSAESLATALRARGERPIRTIKVNAQPVILPWAQMSFAAPQAGHRDGLYRERIAQITAHDGIWKTLPIALEHRFADRAPSPWPEAQLYDRFVTNSDARACQTWHRLTWKERSAFASAHLEDDRLQAFARRLTFLEAPQVLAPDARRDGHDWLRHRLTTGENVPWLTLPAAIASCIRLKGRVAGTGQHRDLDEITAWLTQRLRSVEASS